MDWAPLSTSCYTPICRSMQARQGRAEVFHVPPTLRHCQGRPTCTLPGLILAHFSTSCTNRIDERVRRSHHSANTIDCRSSHASLARGVLTSIAHVVEVSNFEIWLFCGPHSPSGLNVEQAEDGSTLSLITPTAKGFCPVTLDPFELASALTWLSFCTRTENADQFFAQCLRDFGNHAAAVFTVFYLQDVWILVH